MILNPKVGDLVKISSLSSKERGIVIEIVSPGDEVKEMVYDPIGSCYIEVITCRVMWDELPESFIMVAETQNKKITKTGNYLLSKVEE